MKKNPWLTLLVLVLFFIGVGIFFIAGSVANLVSEREPKMSSKSILQLDLEGVILDGKKFLKQLKKYRDDKHVKAIVVVVNSPGGVVGPSQEIYEELKRTRTEFKKPVVMVSNGLIASGAFYAAMGADKIVVQPGTLIGSIGVIMEFANFEKLYDWAKVSRYSITTGKYKDSGAEYRPMREDERELFQSLINEVWNQFKTTVATERKLEQSFVDKYADGRVLNGETAVKLGFADKIGTVDDAFKLAASMANLKDWDVFEPPKPRPSIIEFLSHGGEDDDAKSSVEKLAARLNSQVLKSELVGKPLFLMPGAL